MAFVGERYFYTTLAGDFPGVAAGISYPALVVDSDDMNYTDLIVFTPQGVFTKHLAQQFKPVDVPTPGSYYKSEGYNARTNYCNLTGTNYSIFKW